MQLALLSSKTHVDALFQEKQNMDKDGDVIMKHQKILTI